jgi:chemotaxis methyl-accepting protein methylase
LLRRLVSDESFRIGFLLALFLQKQHGGGFNRYPGQLDFLQQWLKKTRPAGKDVLRCLDTACATGESTYELAMLLLENGMEPGSFLVRGSTIEPLELFAAAHIFFPHEPERQEAFRKRAEPVFTAGADKRMLFFTEDISRPFDEERKEYDIILCNGLLGGPRLHTVTDLEQAASALASRLRKGGILLAADRFHVGWKKCAPASLLCGIFTKFGFRVRDIGDGMAAEKT